MLQENAAPCHFSNGFILYAGLWYDDGGRSDHDHPHGTDLLLHAEAVCGRNDRICEGLT